MITAAQAKEKTKERITQVAKEFITNCVEQAIDEAIAEGKFKATPSFDGVPSPEVTGEEVVKLLQEQGYEAEHVCYDNINGYANYILIKWGTTNEKESNYDMYPQVWSEDKGLLSI